MMATRHGSWIVVICSSLALLTYTAVPAHAGVGSAECLPTESSPAPIWTADFDDGDDDDDGSASALSASIGLTVDHTGRWGVIASDSDARLPGGCEPYSLRGAPTHEESDSASSIDYDSHSHRPRAPPQRSHA